MLNSEIEEKKIYKLQEKIKILEKELKEEKEKSRLDYLTKIPNRYALEEFLLKIGKQKIIDNKVKKYWAISMDLDNFKIINDKKGHDAGDFTLKKVSKILAKKIGLNSDNFYSRFGGDEFFCILNFDSKEDVKRILLEIYKDIVEIKIDNEYSGLSCSIGVVSFSNNNNFEFIYRESDKNMYKAKKTKDLSSRGISGDTSFIVFS